MLLDFELDDLLKLQTVPRWSIIEMTRHQSVAEHSYNVSVIGMTIVSYMMNELDWHKHDDDCFATYIANIASWGLMHDVPEVITGDIPTPLKLKLGSAVANVEKELFPKYTDFKDKISPQARAIIKAADWIDAIHFATRYCVDRKKQEVIDEMVTKVVEHAHESKRKFGMPLPDVVFKMIQL